MITIVILVKTHYIDTTYSTTEMKKKTKEMNVNQEMKAVMKLTTCSQIEVAHQPLFLRDMTLLEGRTQPAITLYPPHRPPLLPLLQYAESFLLFLELDQLLVGIAESVVVQVDRL